MPHDAPSGRHAAAGHRGASGYERARDRVCDALLDLPRPALGRRALAAGAVGGLLVVGAAAGTVTMTGASDDPQRTGADVAADALAADVTGADRGAERTSRDAARPSLDEAKRAAEADGSDRSGQVVTRTSAGITDPREIARALLAERGWQDQFECLDDLYVGESNWRVDADNPTSSAYGIPQALPGEKMASEGEDWATNPATQIRWGLEYIDARYGSPCAANSFKQGNGWY